MQNFQKLATAVAENTVFVLEFLGIVVGIILLSYLIEKIIKKKTGNKERVLTTRKIAIIGAFAALSGILMSMEIPIPGIPEFYKLEIGDLPGIICGFAFGPVAGVMVEFCKILIKVVLRPTSTAFVGELANFIVGCAFVLPATVVYWCRKSKKTALFGCISGGVCMITVGALINGFYLLPTFAKMFFGGDIDTLISVGATFNPLIKDVPTLVMWAAVPMNALKSVIVGTLSMILYQPLRPILKQESNHAFKKSKKKSEE